MDDVPHIINIELPLHVTNALQQWLCVFAVYLLFTCCVAKGRRPEIHDLPATLQLFLPVSPNSLPPTTLAPLIACL